MPSPRLTTPAVLGVLLLAGCAAAGPPDDDVAAGPTAATSASETDAPTSRPPSATPPASSDRPGDSTTVERPPLRPDPRWRFFTEDRARYTSPWFPGSHRVMIDYGCTEAPYYVAVPRCDGEGFHHGVDVALPCGTPLFSGVAGRVVTPAPGTVGPAYGTRPLLLRTVLGGEPVDVLVGHARELLVRPGERVRPGRPIAITGSSAAPDGCHLHLEVRAAGGGFSTARDPAPVVQLRRVR